MPDSSRPVWPVLRCGSFAFDLARRPHVVGIVNVTPSSFSDAGRYFNIARAEAHARQLMAEGADIIDVGGESPRAGAESVPVEDELSRVIPLVEALARSGVPVAIDTRKPEVMAAAIDAGAVMINDTSAALAPGALECVARSDVAVCLVHVRDEPRSAQVAPACANVVADVRDDLVARAEACVAADIARDRIVLDPGYGSGKCLAHNLSLLRALPTLGETGYPILVGVSRKSSLGEITGRPVAERLAASIAGGLGAVARGARLLRVHDVRETVDALKVWVAIDEAA